MKKILLPGIIALFITACGNSSSDEQSQTPSAIAAKKEAAKDDEKEKSTTDTYDPNRGEGKFTKVDVSPTLNAAMAESGNKKGDYAG